MGPWPDPTRVFLCYVWVVSIIIPMLQLRLWGSGCLKPTSKFIAEQDWNLGDPGSYPTLPTLLPMFSYHLPGFSLQVVSLIVTTFHLLKMRYPGGKVSPFPWGCSWALWQWLSPGSEKSDSILQPWRLEVVVLTWHPADFPLQTWVLILKIYSLSSTYCPLKYTSSWNPESVTKAYLFKSSTLFCVVNTVVFYSINRYLRFQFVSLVCELLRNVTAFPSLGRLLLIIALIFWVVIRIVFCTQWQSCVVKDF